MKGLILIRGGGDLASGIALRLHRVGLKILICELAQPLTVRRTVSFSEAVYSNEVIIEGVKGKLAKDYQEAENIVANGGIAVLVDPSADAREKLSPVVVVDARMRKRSSGDRLNNDSMLIGLGPGFTAGVDCHAVIETNRGHFLGRVIWEGQAQDDTGIPGNVQGFQKERVLHSPQDGLLKPVVNIGSLVDRGQTLAYVDKMPITAPFSGLLRGMAHSGLTVKKGMKVGDVDPRLDPSLCHFVSEKTLAIAGGVLEAMLTKPEMPELLWGKD